MFPLNSNDPYIDNNGKRSKLGDAIGSGGGGGSAVSITPVLTEGTKIANFEIDGDEGSLYAPAGGGGGSEIKYYDTTMNSKTYNAKSWDGGIADISGITDYANKHYLSVVARDESGFATVLADTELSLTNYLSIMVYAVNAASNKALKVRIFYY